MHYDQTIGYSGVMLEHGTNGKHIRIIRVRYHLNRRYQNKVQAYRNRPQHEVYRENYKRTDHVGHSMSDHPGNNTYHFQFS